MSNTKGLVILLGLIFFIFIYFLEGRYKYSTTQKTGEELLNAINAFNMDQGIYPSKLQELVPVYMKEVPKTGFGNDFIYFDSIIINPMKPALKGEFTLRYYGRFGVEATFLSNENNWFFDD